MHFGAGPAKDLTKPLPLAGGMVVLNTCKDNENHEKIVRSRAKMHVSPGLEGVVGPAAA